MLLWGRQLCRASWCCYDQASYLHTFMNTIHRWCATLCRVALSSACWLSRNARWAAGTVTRSQQSAARLRQACTNMLLHSHTLLRSAWCDVVRWSVMHTEGFVRRCRRSGQSVHRQPTANAASPAESFKRALLRPLQHCTAMATITLLSVCAAEGVSMCARSAVAGVGAVGAAAIAAAVQGLRVNSTTAVGDTFWPPGCCVA
jgi:hypothetical protein